MISNLILLRPHAYYFLFFLCRVIRNHDLCTGAEIRNLPLPVRQAVDVADFPDIVIFLRIGSPVSVGVHYSMKVLPIGNRDCSVVFPGLLLRSAGGSGHDLKAGCRSGKNDGKQDRPKKKGLPAPAPPGSAGSSKSVSGITVCRCIPVDFLF